MNLVKFHSNSNMLQNIAVSGANTPLRPPPVVNHTFEEITKNVRYEGLFTVNISWIHPIGMYIYVHVFFNRQLELHLQWYCLVTGFYMYARCK